MDSSGVSAAQLVELGRVQRVADLVEEPATDVVVPHADSPAVVALCGVAHQWGARGLVSS